MDGIGLDASYFALAPFLYCIGRRIRICVLDLSYSVCIVAIRCALMISHRIKAAINHGEKRGNKAGNWPDLRARE